MESFDFDVPYIIYSVLNATTGSFLAALLAGINPEKRFKITLIAISIIAAFTGKYAFKLLISVTA